MLILPNLWITSFSSFDFLVRPTALQIEDRTHIGMKVQLGGDLKGHQPLRTKGVQGRYPLKNSRRATAIFKIVGDRQGYNISAMI